MQLGKICLIQIVLVGIIIFLTTHNVLAQSNTFEELYIPPPSEAPPPTPKSDIKSNLILPAPVRRMQRTGTRINGARNSVSIKSTDAGIIHHPPAVPTTPYPHNGSRMLHQPSSSRCIQCGVIDFVRTIDPETMMDAITHGIVAGTVINKIGGYGAYPHLGRGSSNNGTAYSEQHSQHQIGITMHDGSQQIIHVPDASHLHQGDSIRFIDGVIVPEHLAK